MKTHTKLSDTRCIALLSIFATLTTVYALALACRLSAVTSALNASVVSSTEVSAMVGDYGVRREDLKDSQHPRNRRILLRQQRVRKTSAAPVEKISQQRFR